jgi:arginyl-tRNA synthetase
MDKWIYTQEGATFLKTTDFTDDKDRVIIKSDGAYTYLLPDIAYHKDKLERGFTTLVDCLGADHHGYIERMRSSLMMLGFPGECFNVELIQMVRLFKDGQEFKVSKRTGNAVSMKELCEDCGVDAVRYFFVSRAASSHLDFDLDLAGKMDSSNPVYYAQYAHARICSIFRTIETKGYEFKEATSFENINKDATKNLCLTLLKYPMVVEEAASKRLVHKVTHYIDELAYALHSYYNNEKVVSDDMNQTFEKATVLKAVSIVLKDALALMGISAPTQM